MKVSRKIPFWGIVGLCFLLTVGIGGCGQSNSNATYQVKPSTTQTGAPQANQQRETQAPPQAQPQPSQPQQAQAQPQNAPQSDNQSQQPSVDNANSKIDQLIAEGKIIQGVSALQPKSLYKAQQAILIGRDLIVTLNGYRIEVDQYPFREYVIVDFSVMNISQRDYNSALSDFTLISDSGRTYSPSFGAHTAGDIEGVLHEGDMRRGEIAFEAPITQDTVANHPIANPDFSNGFDESPQVVAFLVNLSNAPQTLGQ